MWGQKKRFYWVCHGLRLSKWDDYFCVPLEQFWSEYHFEAYGAVAKVGA